MKKSILFLSLAFTLLFIITSCKKDENSSDEEQNQMTENGLIKDIPPLQNDTIIVNSNMSLTVNQPVTDNDFNTTYTLDLNNFPSNKVKKGTVIIDNSGKGRLWVITEVPNSRPVNKHTTGLTVSAVLGTLATLYQNVIIEFSTPENRSKIASNNPNKLESGKFKFITANGSSSELDINDINIHNFNFENGITFSVNSNTIDLTFNNFQIYSNPNNTLNITIPSGSIKINNALDLKMKYNPIEGIFGGVTMNLGALKDLKTSIYTDIDTDLNINLQTSTGGNYDIIDEETTLGHYTKIIPAGEIIISIDVKLKAKLNINTNAQLNVIPHIINKNNYETRINYNGSIFSNSNMNVYYQNIEKNIETSVTGDFNLNQKLEIYPEIEVYIYGLIGPSGKIIPYEEFNAHAHLNNSLLTWDENIDLGLDYYASLDVSLFHFEHQTNSLAHISGNLFNTTIYHSPHQTEIISGNNQTGTGGTPLPLPIKIKVTDNLNLVASQTPVFFEVVSGGGSVNNDYVYTDSNGIAEVNWTLGNVVGPQSLKIYLKDGNENVISGTIQTINATASGTSSLPTLTTLPVSNITSNSADIGGDITDNGGSPISIRGVCYSTNPNPTTADDTTNDGTGIGSFTTNLTGLNDNTTYYVRAYATNGVGTAYGNEVQFTTQNNQLTVTDFDGNIYETVQIGSQIWMKENLKVTHYADGTPIPLVMNNTDWDNLQDLDKAYCWYNNDLTNKDIYGALYTFSAATNGNITATENVQGVCPNGWHIPTQNDISILYNYLETNYGVNYTGGSLKQSGLNYWQSPNTNATNSTGFTGLPSGERNYDGTFIGINQSAIFHRLLNVTSSNNTYSHFGLSYDTGNLIGGTGNGNGIRVGKSCRCIKD